jgi:hypothetical protein
VGEPLSNEMVGTKRTVLLRVGPRQAFIQPVPGATSDAESQNPFDLSDGEANPGGRLPVRQVMNGRVRRTFERHGGWGQKAVEMSASLQRFLLTLADRQKIIGHSYQRCLAIKTLKYSLGESE